ncbi:MAG: ribose-phosphate diphosphokinase [bacterium]|nr:ribose-phosphate diphosphokinase [bacterium]
MDTNSLKIIFGPSCAPSLRKSVISKINWLADRQHFTHIPWQDHRFADGEFLPQILENVRGNDVFIIQPTNPPEENFKYVKMLAQAAALASAKSVTVVLPYHRDLRQDRKDRPRVAVTAKLSLREIECSMTAASSRHIMFFHPHFSQVIGFVDVTCDLLYPTAIFFEYMQRQFGDRLKHVVPAGADTGAAGLAARYAKLINTDSFAVGYKIRDKNDSVSFRDIIGDIDGKIVAVVDDMIDTGGTLCKFIQKANEKGAQEIYAFATHAILAGDAISKLQEVAAKTCLKKVILTNSINNEQRDLNHDLFEVLDCGPLIGEAIWRTHVGGSISEIAGAFA